MEPFFARLRAPKVTILDIGASLVEGQQHRYSGLVNSDRADLIGFEPIPEECERLNARKKSNETFLPYLLGDGGDRTLYVTRDPYCSSMLEPNGAMIGQFQAYKQMMAVDRKIPMRTTRLDDIPELSRGVDYLKIDVQGGEMDVLSNARRLLAGALVVEAEVWFLPFYTGQPLFADVDQFLRGLGFRFLNFTGYGGQKLAPFAVGQFGDQFSLAQLIWCDATYVRDLSASLDPERHLKMATICLEVFRAIDFAYQHLRQYDEMVGTRHAQALVAEHGIRLP